MSLDEKSAKEGFSNKTAASTAEACVHMLPCTVDFSGRLPGAAHWFQPTPLKDNDDSGATGEERLFAATLRGRGLLGKETNVNADDAENSPSAAFCVLKVGPGEQSLSVEGSKVNRAIEWQHEHVPGNLKHVKSRLDRARAWLEVSRALHEPVPPPEEF